MATLQEKVSTAWQDAINLVLGAWLVLSPLILGYVGDRNPAWNAFIVGAAIFILAAAAIWAFQKWEEWINVLLGLWLIVSPWALGFNTMPTPLWNQIIVGVLTGGLALWSVNTEHTTPGVASR
jgi:predicted MFS family arabinose efflux permease